MGQLPTYAFFHAETTTLLRAAAANGGTLAGKNIKLTTSRELCINCENTLPMICLELGNPTVEFMEPSGRLRTMHDGRWIDAAVSTRKRTNFATFKQDEWPDPEQLKPYFFGPPGEEWFNHWGNDTAGLSIKGLDGTENNAPWAQRIDLDLELYGRPGLGVLLLYRIFGGGYSEAWTSKGDTSRLREWVTNLHGDLLSEGLFVPFPHAYEAVKEFIENDGKLPSCIDWIVNRDLPHGTFPDPAVEPK